MGDNIEIRGKEIYRWLNDNPDERKRMLANEAIEYVVCEDSEADSGIVVYCRNKTGWSCNYGERALIRHLIALLEQPAKPPEPGELREIKDILKHESGLLYQNLLGRDWNKRTEWGVSIGFIARICELSKQACEYISGLEVNKYRKMNLIESLLAKIDRLTEENEKLKMNKMVYETVTLANQELQQQIQQLEAEKER